MDRLRAASAAGHGSVILLLGEAGFGKTAVVEEAVARAASAGSTVLTGRADPDEGAPVLALTAAAGEPCGWTFAGGAGGPCGRVLARDAGQPCCRVVA